MLKMKRSEINDNIDARPAFIKEKVRAFYYAALRVFSAGKAEKA